MADRRLQVFATVARLLSFTKAAEALHMTQPAVTFQIRQLEDYFNTRLFDRTHNRISLTSAGHLVKGYSDQILSLYSEMDNEVRKLTGDVLGPLVLGASTTIGEYVIPSILGEYQAKFPDVAVRLHVANTDGVLHMVESNEIDIGIVEGPVGNKNLVSKVCWDDELVVVTPPNHPLTEHSVSAVDALLQYPFISREEGSGTRNVIVDYLQSAGHDISDLNLTMEFGSPESIKSAVAAGLGISILSIATLDKELELGMLSKLSLDPPLTRPFSIVYQRQKFRLRAMDEFLEFTEAHCVEKTVGKIVSQPHLGVDSMAKSDQHELRAVIEVLTDAEVASVLDFARYLRDRRPVASAPLPEIMDIPRPEHESVINAIRRLTQTYPMLNRDTLFNEASGLMARHMMHGETSEDTIDRLEALFKSRYATWQAESSASP